MSAERLDAEVVQRRLRELSLHLDRLDQLGEGQPGERARTGVA